jgi:hypothetical protein
MHRRRPHSRSAATTLEFAIIASIVVLLLLDADKLTEQVSWSAPSHVSPANTPSYLDNDPTLVPPGQKVIRNYVTVTVSYQWQPEIFFYQPITLTSTSTMAMSY